MTTKLTIALVEKTGNIKNLTVKDYNENDLYKKCGFKKQDGFLKHNEWTIKYMGHKYIVALYGKVEGKAGMENKYDFPPPVDSVLYFGTCALVLKKKNQETNEFVLMDLTRELWEKLYEKLFGGFEDLTALANDDENEVDELAIVPASKKTKQGYLKDGFVVDSSDASSDEEFDDDVDDDDVEDEMDGSAQEQEDDILLEDLEEELSSEDYISEDDDDEDDDEDVKKE
jgi:hypothetical protein